VSIFLRTDDSSLARKNPPTPAKPTWSKRKHLDGGPAGLHELVTSDVRRAARLIDAGLRSFLLAGAQPVRYVIAGLASHTGHRS
jgi:hypothetical protein